MTAAEIHASSVDSLLESDCDRKARRIGAIQAKAYARGCVTWAALARKLGVTPQRVGQQVHAYARPVLTPACAAWWDAILAVPDDGTATTEHWAAARATTSANVHRFGVTAGKVQP